MSGFTKGGRDFLELGTYNLFCAYCGRKRKANELVMDDEFARKLYVCPKHRDLRQPQEFARGVKEDLNVPFTQPPLTNFVTNICTLEGRSALPGLAIPNCMIPSFNPPPPDPLFGYVEINPGKSAIPSLAMPGEMIPSYNPVALV